MGPIPVNVRALLLFAAIAVAGPRLDAQEPERVSGAALCAECAIVLNDVVTLGGLQGAGLEAIAFESHVAVDAHDRVLVSLYREPQISVFDMAGTFVRTVGRRGEGPGEYQFISHVAADPRYVHVFDYEGAHTVLDEDFQVVRTGRLAAEVLSSAALEPGRIAFVGDLRTPASAGHKLHVIDLSGSVASFGASSSPHIGPTAHRFVVAGNAETLWAVQQAGVNQLFEWDLSPEPRVRRVYHRVVDEFEKDNTPGFSFPMSSNVGAMLDGEGLWIAWNAPDSEWTERDSRQGERLPDVPMQKIYDGWLDLVDPSTGQTVARTRLDSMLLGFASGSSYLVAYRESDAGVPYITLLAPTLSRTP